MCYNLDVHLLVLWFTKHTKSLLHIVFFYMYDSITLGTKNKIVHFFVVNLIYSPMQPVILTGFLQMV